MRKYQAWSLNQHKGDWGGMTTICNHLGLETNLKENCYKEHQLE